MFISFYPLFLFHVMSYVNQSRSTWIEERNNHWWINHWMRDKTHVGKQNNTNRLIEISLPHNYYLQEKCYEKVTTFSPRQNCSKRGIKRSAHCSRSSVCNWRYPKYLGCDVDNIYTHFEIYLHNRRQILHGSTSFASTYVVFHAQQIQLNAAEFPTTVYHV